MYNFSQLLERVRYFGIRKLFYIAKNTSDVTLSFLTDNNIVRDSRFHQTLVKRSVSRCLITTYEGNSGHNINFSQYFVGFGLIHYSILRNIRPENILCIGSKKGFIPAILALACRDNNMGHVDFVDAGYDEETPEKHWSGIGFWKKENPTDHFSKIGVADYITTFVMTTKEFAKKIPRKRYQYIYIDGDHSYDGVKLDYKLFWPKLDSGGFMCFHDIIATGYLDKGKFGVKKFWSELTSGHSIIFPFPDSAGLGMLQKI